MWIMLSDCFLSIVKKDCPDGSLLVRARRPGDIEKVFGRRVKVTRLLNSDYLFRAVIPRDDVTRAIQDEVLRIDYGNFKDSVSDNELHDAYMKVWTAMSLLQNPRPYSEPYYDKGRASNPHENIPWMKAQSVAPMPKHKKKGGKKWKAAIPQPIG